MFFVLNYIKYVTIYMVITMQNQDEKIMEKEYEFNLEKFDDLLNFDSMESIKIETKKDEHTNIIRVKEIEEQDDKINKENSQIDFSIFDKLLDDFTEPFHDNKFQNNTTINKIDVSLSIDDLNYIKEKIKYYENIIENKYNLDNIEADEKNILELNTHLLDVKKMYSEIQQQFNNLNNKEELLNLINKCRKEINFLEVSLNINYKLTNTEIRLINDAINKQERLINKFKIKISHVDDELKLKNSLLVLKKMIFNSFKMLVGIYLMHANENNFVKVLTGSLFILNSIIGMRKAINSDLNNLKYHKYKDYDVKENILENTKLVVEILELSNENIIKLQTELKDKFSYYKEYFHDYEEIYFSICNIKNIIEKSTKKLNDLLVEVK